MPATRTVYKADADRYYDGERTEHENPMSPGQFMPIANAYPDAPAAHEEGVDIVRRSEDGTAWEITTPEAESPPEPLTLDQIKAQKAFYVDFTINGARRAYITPIAGQDTIYREKREDLAFFNQDTDDPIDPANYKYMYLEAQDAGATMAEVAAVYQAMIDQTDLISPPMETLRTGTKRRIMAATTEAEIATEIAAFDAAVAAGWST